MQLLWSSKTVLHQCHHDSRKLFYVPNHRSALFSCHRNCCMLAGQMLFSSLRPVGSSLAVSGPSLGPLILPKQLLRIASYQLNACVHVQYGLSTLWGKFAAKPNEQNCTFWH